MAIILKPRSLLRLEGVHPDLVRVVHRAADMSDLDFTVLEGRRTLDKQKQLLAQGATKTLNSRHLTGHAVDLAPMLDFDNDGKIETFEMFDWPLTHRLAKIVKAAAVAENVPLTWGGDWRTFKDGPHWELPWKQYPKGE
jgi:peptidoglycan L-alanyl-D-glutamate endopeptidase CwlK